MATFENNQTSKKATSFKSSISGFDDSGVQNKKEVLSCRLTTPKLRERKETVIKSLKSKILTKKELKNGYAYKLVGTDKMLDDLVEFIKAEKVCCGFFIFNLSISGGKNNALLKITGPKGVKDFIKTELELYLQNCLGSCKARKVIESSF